MILNPLPRDLALAEFDFMNCEAAMLKVCKLDINWAAEGWGAGRVGGFSLLGDVRRLRPQTRTLRPRGCSGDTRTELDRQEKLPKPQTWDFWLCWRKMDRSLHLLSLRASPCVPWELLLSSSMSCLQHLAWFCFHWGLVSKTL